MIFLTLQKNFFRKRAEGSYFFKEKKVQNTPEVTVSEMHRVTTGHTNTNHRLNGAAVGEN